MKMCLLWDVYNVTCLFVFAVTMLFATLFFILEKLTQIAEKHRMITQSSDPAALSKITDGLHTNVTPVTVRQDNEMFFLSSVVMSLGL